MQVLDDIVVGDSHVPGGGEPFGLKWPLLYLHVLHSLGIIIQKTVLYNTCLIEKTH